MPLYRQTLRAFPTAPDALGAIDALLASYKAAHKRNPTIALFYSLTATPDLNLPKVTKDTHAITIHAEDVGKQMEEVLWFDRAAQAL